MYFSIALFLRNSYYHSLEYEDFILLESWDSFNMSELDLYTQYYSFSYLKMSVPFLVMLIGGFSVFLTLYN